MYLDKLNIVHLLCSNIVAKAEISNDEFDELVSQGNYSAVFNGNVSYLLLNNLNGERHAI